MADTLDIIKKYKRSTTGALRQGEIVTGLNVYSALRREGQTEISEFGEVEFPVAVVVSQDCDLDWDYKARFSDRSNDKKLLRSVLFCEAEEAAIAKSRGLTSEVWKRIVQNKDERYQFLESIPASHDDAGQGIGELVLDFKRYFALLTADAYGQIDDTATRRCRLQPPYVQHLATRFYYFQYRVALPQDHESEPAK